MGFTKNTGTVTGVTLNNQPCTIVNGIVQLEVDIPAYDDVNCVKRDEFNQLVDRIEENYATTQYVDGKYNELASGINYCTNDDISYLFNGNIPETPNTPE